MRFLLDENVPRQVGHFLRAQGYDTLIVRDSEWSGKSDPELWQLAVQDQRVIITHDRDFPLPGVDGLPVAVVLIRPHDNRPAAIEALFKAFWTAIKPDDLIGQVVSVQAGRFRKRPLR